MTRVETGELVRSAAKVYEAFLIPALVEEWTDRVTSKIT